MSKNMEEEQESDKNPDWLWFLIAGVVIALVVAGIFIYSSTNSAKLDAKKADFSIVMIDCPHNTVCYKSSNAINTFACVSPAFLIGECNNGSQEVSPD